MKWLSKILGTASKNPIEVPPDNSGIKSESNHKITIASLLDEYLKHATKHRQVHYGNDLESLETYTRIKSADRAEQAKLVDELVAALVPLDRKASEYRRRSVEKYNLHLDGGWNEIWNPRRLLHHALESLMKRKLPLTRESLSAMLNWCTDDSANVVNITFYPLSAMLRSMEEFAGDGSLIDEWVPDLIKLAKLLNRNQPDAATRKLIDRIDALAGRSPELPLIHGEAWSDAAISEINKLDAATIAAWVELLIHCKSATGSTPSAKWHKQAAKHLEAIGHDPFVSLVTRWFALVDKRRTQSSLTDLQWAARCASEEFSRMYHGLYQLMPADRMNYRKLESLRESMLRSESPWDFLCNLASQPEAIPLFGDHPPVIQLAPSPRAYDAIEDRLIIEPHMDLLCGLAWISGQSKDVNIARSLSELATSAFRKVPGKGPRAVRVGNACIGSLGMMGTSEALGQLALLRVKTKFGGAQIAITKALTKLSDELGIPPEELEEMSVPAYGMEEVGRLILRIGDITGILTIVNSHTTSLEWIRANGKSQKSLPAEIKQEHPEDLKELLALKKDIEKMLPAQAERLDNLYLLNKSWPLTTWQDRYLNHPLIGSLARRLIWKFTTNGVSSSGFWSENGIADRHGNPLVLDENVTTVRLWHPMDESADAVLEWRTCLESEEIVQPFKQAHREIYLIAPAEENTRIYSNRFAAHILRQHQFHALCATRGWKNKLRLMVDSEYPPATRWLPEWGLRAEFWVEGASEETLESGAYRYITTDQVRFYQHDATQATAHAGGGGYSISRYQVPAEPLPLIDVDSLVFSEIMRDVDLFTGVTSVGNDPNWLDTGTNEPRRGYWENSSFGELNGSAQTRKTILERLIPKLKIASQCTMGDRFLEVQGTRHRYKIHLGSGNIIISPQGKYLCIVPAQAQVDKAGEKLFLPFEGDRTLSVILSKAFLLSADDKITDTTILQQL